MIDYNKIFAKEILQTCFTLYFLTLILKNFNLIIVIYLVIKIIYVGKSCERKFEEIRNNIFEELEKVFLRVYILKT